MEYTVKFNFNTMEGNEVTGMSGESDITSDDTPETLKESKELIGLIANDMAQETGMNILSVDIQEINLK